MATCQSCRKPVPEGTAHCPHCGAGLEAAAPAPKKTVFGYAPGPADMQRLQQGAAAPPAAAPGAPAAPAPAAPAAPAPAAAPAFAPPPAAPAFAPPPGPADAPQPGVVDPMGATTAAPGTAPQPGVDPMGATQFVGSDPVTPEASQAGPGVLNPTSTDPTGMPAPATLLAAPTDGGLSALPPGAPPADAPPVADVSGTGIPGTVMAGVGAPVPGAPMDMPGAAVATPMGVPGAPVMGAPGTGAGPAFASTLPAGQLPVVGRAPAGLYLGTILGGWLLSVGLTVLGVVNFSHMHELLFFSWMPMIVTAVFFCILVYKAWAAIQDGHTPVTPGKAVGFMFIPFFNIYWAFIAIGSWGKEYNEFAHRNQIPLPEMQPGLFVAYPIVACCCMVPFVNFLAAPAMLVLMVLIVLKLCEGVNAIAGQDG